MREPHERRRAHLIEMYRNGALSSLPPLRYQRADVDYLAAIAANLSTMIEGSTKP